MMMLNLPQYQETDQLYAGTRTLVYRAIRAIDSQPVIIKVLRNPHPNFNELVQFCNQYIITHNLEHPAIVQPLALDIYGNGYALVMPDDGAIALSDYWQVSTRSLTEFLDIAIQLAQALHYLIEQRIIHKDIKPSNILIHPKTRQVKLIDFSISSWLPKEQQQLTHLNGLEGTLAYISPEQTGRMNRGIDYRTDFYSLGVTFFELLTGKLPFETSDPMELVHCHIAKMPPELGNGEEIPQVVSNIVMRLMAKNAEDRYQSALGLKHDLERCLQQWEATKKITPFKLGARDVCDRFLIPEKLYGREAEVQILLNAFERVANSPESGHRRAEIILLAGFSGIGKTAVVNEVHKPIIKQRGYFIKGKFDQFNCNIPFSAFVQAFRDLMSQLLGESDADLANWTAKILEAVGENGQVLIDVIPELEQIIGKQPTVPELSGSAAQNRFNLLFGKFVRVFTTKEHPLVIFLDDLQWADSASLNLLKLLMDESEVGYLLVLGAYRDNEVFPAHPLILTLDDITKQGANINTLTLAPLDEADINRLVADTLLCSVEIAAPLSQLVYQKTQGNPFFATQFLKGLHEDGWIKFEAKVGYWQCDLAQVRQLALTDDVVEFMVGRLRKLPQATQEVLKLAACIGNRFDLATLAVVCDRTQEEVASDIWTGLQEGFVVPESESYKFFQTGDYEVKEVEEIAVGYRWLHDRVQQAAYALIPDDQKQTTHYRIGQLLLQKIPSETREDRIFELVSQLNYGIAFITEQKERDKLAQFNLIACRKARSTTAYQAGREYAKTGLSLLGENAWQRQYEMSLAFHDIAAELASLCGDFEAMEQFIGAVIAQAHSLLEQVNVYRMRILSNTSRNKLTEAIAIAQQVLQQLGVNFSEAPKQNDIQQVVAEINQLIANRNIEDLVNLPMMTDREKIAIVQIANSVIPVAYVVGSPLFSLLVALSVKLSIQYGNTSVSAFIYACYGIIACNMQQDVDAGVKFGQLALQIVSKLEAKAVKPEVLMVVGAFLLHRKSHIREMLTLLQEGYGAALEVGNLEYVGYTAQYFCLNSFWCSQPLVTLEQETRAYCHALMQLNQLTTANYCRIYWQSILNLLGIYEHPIILSGEAIQEAEFLPRLLCVHDSMGLYFFYLYKLMLCYLFGEIESAQNYAVEASRYSMAGSGFVSESSFYFYNSLTALAALSPCSEETLEAFQQVEQNQTQLQQYWAYYAPMNHQHKVDLVEAEKCRVLGQKIEAIELYDRAIAGAKENGYTQDEALANELAAKFYLAWGKEKIAAVYMQEAYYCYARWGAKAKTDHLEKTYPQLLTPILQQPQSPLNLSNQQTSTQNFGTVTTATSVLDLISVIEASQALSEEIELDALLSKLMHIVIENAGADKGALILDNSGTWEIAAQCVNGNCHLSTIPLDQADNLPSSIINTVKRTQQTLLINNIKQDKTFTTDPYLFQQQPQSLCCTPILNQGKLVGILYLENHLTTEAFTPDRIKVLNLLTTQAAISIENARLYQRVEDYNRTLERQVAERTEQLQQKNQELAQTLQELKATQDGLIQSEKMAALGQLVAGIAHEINTPLGAIRAAIGNTDKALEGALSQIPQLLPQLNSQQQADFFSVLEQSLRHQPSLSTREKREIKRTLTQQLESHAIANAKQLAHLLTEGGLHHSFDAQLSLLQTPQANQIVQIAYDIARLHANSQTINNAVERSSKIVFALKSYARYDRSGEKQSVQITEGIETVLELYHNYLKKGVTVIRHYQPVPEISCYPDELVQVWTNLIHNAVQAMDSKGTLDIGVRQQNQEIVVEVTDSGCGIPPEIKDKIFQPFFTTKPAGEGSGLGLDIVQKIIEKHQGTITFASVPGNTTFTVTLPMQ
jgi:predicted ATPase/signal transduction histidine kinase